MRPVRLDDAAFIVWLLAICRTSKDAWVIPPWTPRVNRRGCELIFRGRTTTILSLKRWVNFRSARMACYDLQGDSAESGRWVMRPDVPAATPHALIAFDTAFGQLGLRELRARTISTNQSVLSLNVKLGFKQTLVEPNAQLIGGKPVDQIHFVLSREDWPARRQKLLPLAQLAERQVKEWEKSQKP